MDFSYVFAEVQESKYALNLFINYPTIKLLRFTYSVTSVPLFERDENMEIKNMIHAGVNGKFIPNDKWNKIVELINHNNQLIRELKEELEE